MAGRKPILVTLDNGRTYEVLAGPTDMKGRSTTRIYRRVPKGRIVRVGQGNEAIGRGGYTLRRLKAGRDDQEVAQVAAHFEARRDHIVKNRRWIEAEKWVRRQLARVGSWFRREKAE